MTVDVHAKKIFSVIKATKDERVPDSNMLP